MFFARAVSAVANVRPLDTVVSQEGDYQGLYIMRWGNEGSYSSRTMSELSMIQK